MELPKIFDALTIPDPDTFRSAANNLHAGNDVYNTYHLQLLAGHDTLKASWQGDASDQYSVTYQQMHQLQQQHQEQLQQAANIHLGVAVLLEAAQVAQDIAIGLLAGAGIEFIAGFFTAGATDVLAAPETAAAIQTEAGAQGSAAAARAALQAGFRALVWLTEGWKNHKLIFDAGGAILGAGSGLIYSVEHHDSLGQTGVNVGMDAWMGFDLGRESLVRQSHDVDKNAGGHRYRSWAIYCQRR